MDETLESLAGVISRLGSSEGCLICEDEWKGLFNLNCNDCCVRWIMAQPNKPRRISALSVIERRRGKGAAEVVKKLVEEKWLGQGQPR